MSERACQLCGKPLSRIRVGGGEEFCSREHRTQYRLRRGMDRLQEANKVASLMRRRENPKPIAVSPVAEMVWRGYFQPMPDATQAVRLPARNGRGRLTPGLPAAGYAAPSPAGGPGRMERRAAQVPAQPGIAQNVALPRVGVHTSCGVPQAQAALPPAAAPVRDAARRQEILPRRDVRSQVVPPKAANLRARSDGAAAAAFREVHVPSREGMLLRVSRAVGFRLPARETRSIQGRGPVVSTLRWPGLLSDACTANPSAAARETEVMRVSFPRRAIEAGGGWRPAPHSYPGAPPPEAIWIETPSIDFAASARVSDAQWTRNTEIVHAPERISTIPGAQLSPVLRLAALAAIPVEYKPEQRVSGIPFGSGDMTLGYSDEEHSIQ